MRLSTGFITAAYGAKVLALDATDYLGQLTDLYESYGTDAVRSIADLYQTDNSFLQQYQTIAEDLTNKPWYSDLLQVTNAAEASKITGESWFTSYENWASSVAGVGGFYNGGSGSGTSADNQESGSGAGSSAGSSAGSGSKSGSKSESKPSSSGVSVSNSFSSDASNSQSSGSGGSGSESSDSGGSGSESSSSGSGSGSGSGSSSSADSGSGSSSSADSDANISYAPFGATLCALILALI